MSRPGSVSLHTLVVMVMTATSRLLGFVRIAIIAAIFGASGNADVLNLVFNIPNNLRKLLAEGALSSAFVPELARSLVEDPGGERSRRIVSHLIGLQLVILAPLLLAATLAPAPIVNAILDFPEPARQALAAELFRYLIHYVLLISIAAILMGTLNAHRRYTIPAASPLLFSVAVIASVLLLHRRLGIFSMAVGVLAGGTLQLASHVPLTLRLGYRIRPSLGFTDPHFRRILRRWIPVVSTASIFVINQQIALLFASGLADGSGSALTNALVFWQLPFGVFSASITTVLFPIMSRDIAREDYDALSRNVTRGLSGHLLLLVPSAVGLIMLGHGMIAVALQRGAFSAAASARTAVVLSGFAPGLFSVGAYTFLQRVYYSAGDYRTPLRVAIVTMVVDVALSLWLKETRLAVAGLAVANSTAFSVGLVLLLLPARRLGVALDWRPLLRAAGQSVVASAAAVAAVIALRAGYARGGHPRWWTGEVGVSDYPLLAGELAVSLVVLVLTYRLVGVRLREAMRGRTWNGRPSVLE